MKVTTGVTTVLAAVAGARPAGPVGRGAGLQRSDPVANSKGKEGSYKVPGRAPSVYLLEHPSVRLPERGALNPYDVGDVSHGVGQSAAPPRRPTRNAPANPVGVHAAQVPHAVAAKKRSAVPVEAQCSGSLTPAAIGVQSWAIATAVTGTVATIGNGFLFWQQRRGTRSSNQSQIALQQQQRSSSSHGPGPVPHS